MSSHLTGVPVESDSTAVTLRGFSLEACRSIARSRDVSLGQAATIAIYDYLGDRMAPPPGWAYPEFLAVAGEVERGRVAELVLKVDAKAWLKLFREAERQHVPAESLCRHAILYSAAGRDRRSSS
jgi:hypothetical protein